MHSYHSGLKSAAGGACRLCILAIRVLPSARACTRHAHSVRACALGQTGCQRRVQGWQALHSYHLGLKSAAGEVGRLRVPFIRALPSARVCARHAHTVRACALGQIGCQHRVWDWQALRSYHSSATLRRSVHPARTFCASMCSLTNRLPASRAELAVSTFPPIRV